MKAVFASGSMSQSYFRELCPQQHAEYAMLAQAKQNGTLENLTQYSKEEPDFINGEDMDKFAALFGVWSRWRPVALTDLSSNVSIYSGTKDFNQEMVLNTTDNQVAFGAHGINTHCFEGLTHYDLISQKNRTSAWVLEHLA